MKNRVRVLAIFLGVTIGAAAPALAQDHEVEVGGEAMSNEGSDRVIVGLEGAVIFPFTDPQLAEYYPGGTISLATVFAVTKFLAPLFRLRAAWLSAQEAQTGYLATASLGVRFRPRGIAHPEEPSRASCIWAEIDASIAAWNGEARPAYEVALGFDFEAGDVTLGPVVRFVHVIEFEHPDEPQTYLLTAGLEILLNDAR
ncbi:MAG: hypothetical protein AB7S26_14660 [Sandaracinaceae bacterium]